MACPSKREIGDPLFSAFVKEWSEDTKAEQKHISNGIQDPCYLGATDDASQALPLHSYYSEYRWGHGDPLMMAAMKRWPYTTVPEDQQMRHLPRTQALAIPPCRTIIDPSIMSVRGLPHDMMHMDNVGHIEQSGAEGERRFILLSDERRYVIVNEWIIFPHKHKK